MGGLDGGENHMHEGKRREEKENILLNISLEGSRGESGAIRGCLQVST